MKPVFKIALFALVGLGLCSCDDENAAKRNALQQEVQQANEALVGLSSDELTRQSKIDELNKEFEDEKNALSQDKAQVDAYLLDHKMVVIAIAAGAAGANAVIDPNNEYSQDAHQIGGIVVFIAIAYALSHADEVTEVVSYLSQADSAAKQIRQQMATTAQALSQQQSALESDKQQTQQKNASIEALNSQIENLPVKHWWNNYF